jgi:hypothetical protein
VSAVIFPAQTKYALTAKAYTREILQPVVGRVELALRYDFANGHCPLQRDAMSVDEEYAATAGWADGDSDCGKLDDVDDDDTASTSLSTVTTTTTYDDGSNDDYDLMIRDGEFCRLDGPHVVGTFFPRWWPFKQRCARRGGTALSRNDSVWTNCNEMDGSEQNSGVRQQQKGLKQHRMTRTTMTTRRKLGNDDQSLAIIALQHARADIESGAHENNLAFA